QFEFLHALIVNNTRAARDHLVQEIFLGAEVIIGERKIDARTLGDGAERDAIEAAFGKTPLGRVEDREPGRVAASRDQALAARLRLALRRLPPPPRRPRPPFLSLHSHPPLVRPRPPPSHTAHLALLPTPPSKK